MNKEYNEYKKRRDIPEIRIKVNNIKLKPIGENDWFCYDSKHCGQCCKNKDNVFFTSYDAYRASKYLNMKLEDFSDKYLDYTIGGYSKIVVAFAKQNMDKSCIFSKFNPKSGEFECMLGNAKPQECGLYPIRMLHNVNKETGEDIITYAIEENLCENSQIGNVSHQVKQWVKPYTKHIEEIKASYKLQTIGLNYFNTRQVWFFMHELERILNDNRKLNLKKQLGITVKETKNVMDFIDKINENTFEYHLFCLYYTYEVSESYLEQVNKCIDSISKIFEIISNYYKDAVDLYTEKILSKQKITFDEHFIGFDKLEGY